LWLQMALISDGVLDWEDFYLEGLLTSWHSPDQPGKQMTC